MSFLTALKNTDAFLMTSLIYIFVPRKVVRQGQTIVSRGDWLGNAANIRVENNGAVGYVGSFLTVHSPLFLFTNYD